MRFLDMAFHCHLPPMDGADLRAWQLYKGMIAAGAEGRFIGRTVSVRNAEPAKAHSPARSWREWKALTALAALATGGTYWQLKMLRPGARREVSAALDEGCQFGLLNMLSALPLAQPLLQRGIPLVVDTHNYDPAWFEAMAAASRNPVLRRLCRRNVRYVEHALKTLPQGTVLVHVSEQDARRSRRDRPDLEHVIVENGATIAPRRRQPVYATPGRKVLMFVGSLSAKMNQDALEYFATRFWPHLRAVAEFRVVGSAPPAGIHTLSREQGWALFPNATEAELAQLYAEAHFAVLPFAYGEGSKLKFFEACGRGVPVLATPTGLCGVPHVPDLVSTSDTPAEWKHRIQAGFEPEPEAVKRLIAFAETFSWPRLASRLFQIIHETLLRPAEAQDNHPCREAAAPRRIDFQAAPLQEE